ncbi:urease accessory protein UreF [Solimonas marina]|uniref:Urease accessory protein UreF n=1 Tax=Solimonas marina TaxID=2714601 RepID=A0A970B6W9_9GAMM|nr:urease accessory protein UreF [Solimonas marina]NKF23045.1 urease accessory protein UreF [Solimonas marina]
MSADFDPGSDTLYRLLAWTSPSYPVGAFSYSHGLEWAIECGDVRDVATLVAYIETVLRHGGAWMDAVLFSHAWQAADDDAAFDEISELAAALRGTAETALESRQQAQAFLQVTRRAWPHPWLDAFAERQRGRHLSHAVVMALACAAHGIALTAALHAYLHGFAANLVSAGVRLVPLGQTDGQIATARLAPIVADVARRAPACELDDLGSAAPMLDLFSMHHETQYTRLFRS